MCVALAHQLRGLIGASSCRACLALNCSCSVRFLLTPSPALGLLEKNMADKTVPLKSRQQAALDHFSEACVSCGFSIPTAVRDALDWPLDGTEDLTEEEKMKATSKMERHGWYTQWARLLRVAGMAGYFQQCFSIVLCLTLNYAV